MVVVGAAVVAGAAVVGGGSEAAVTGTTTGRGGRAIVVVVETGGALLAAAAEATVTGGAIVVAGAEVVGGALVVGGIVVGDAMGQLTLVSVAPTVSLASSPERLEQYDSAGMPPNTKLEALEFPEITAVADRSGFGFPCASVFEAFSSKMYWVVLPAPLVPLVLLDPQYCFWGVPLQQAVMVSGAAEGVTFSTNSQ